MECDGLQYVDRVAWVILNFRQAVYNIHCAACKSYMNTRSCSLLPFELHTIPASITAAKFELATNNNSTQFMCLFLILLALLGSPNENWRRQEPWPMHLWHLNRLLSLSPRKCRHGWDF